MAEPDPLTEERLELGSKIRRLRTASGLTLSELAVRTGVSLSLVSQVERGLAEPSLSTLRGLSASLGVPVSALFVGDDDVDERNASHDGRRLVVRKGARKHLRMPDSDTVYELLSPDLNRQMEVIFTEMPGGARVPTEPSQHPGEETIVCISGRVTCVQQGDEWDLEAGDAISWDSSRPHWIENRSKRRAVLLAVITPPNF